MIEEIFQRLDLMPWVKALIMTPEKKQRYLYLEGPANSGKSLVHEILSLFVKTIRYRPHRYWNDELEGPVLCAVEDGKPPTAELVFCHQIEIHEKGKRARHVPNQLNWIQVEGPKPNFDVQLITVAPISVPVRKSELMKQALAERDAFLFKLRGEQDDHC